MEVGNGEEGFNQNEEFKSSEVNTVIQFLMGNARSLESEGKIKKTSTIALPNKSNELVFWETGMRETNFSEIDGYTRVIHAAKTRTGFTNSHRSGHVD